MKLSGADQWLDRIVTLARDEFGRLGWRLRDAETAWAALARGFRRDALTSAAARCLLGTLDASEREAAVVRLRSPLVQRAARLRDEASSPEHARVYRRFVSRLADSPPPSSRLALVQTLERASGATGFELEMRRAVRRAVNGALRPLMVPEHTVPPEPNDTQEAGAEEVERLRFRRVTMLLFAYRTMPLGDLEDLVRLARTPGRARFVEVYHDCIRTALVAAERGASLEARPLAAGRRGAR